MSPSPVVSVRCRNQECRAEFGIQVPNPGASDSIDSRCPNCGETFDLGRRRVEE